MQKLLKGLQHHQTKIFVTQRELLERLSQGQSPLLRNTDKYEVNYNPH